MANPRTALTPDELKAEKLVRKVNKNLGLAEELIDEGGFALLTKEGVPVHVEPGPDTVFVPVQMVTRHKTFSS